MLPNGVQVHAHARQEVLRLPDVHPVPVSAMPIMDVLTLCTLPRELKPTCAQCARSAVMASYGLCTSGLQHAPHWAHWLAPWQHHGVQLLRCCHVWKHLLLDGRGLQLWEHRGNTNQALNNPKTCPETGTVREVWRRRTGRTNANIPTTSESLKPQAQIAIPYDGHTLMVLGTTFPTSILSRMEREKQYSPALI
jgi:hypothetical protein